MEALASKYNVDLTKKKSQLESQSKKIESIDSQLKTYIELGKKYGLDLKDLNQKLVSSRYKGIPVVPPQSLEEIDFLEEKIAAFKRDKDNINKKEKLKAPEEQEMIYMSKEQEVMVFCNNRSACVVAGAGSGKSTTLVLRVIFLHYYLDIPFGEITVCTFTRESRKDFIKKLLSRCEQWGIRNFNEINAESIVRTFHSLAYETNKYLNPFEQEILFDKAEEDDEERYDTDDLDMYRIPNAMELAKKETNHPSKTELMQTELAKELYTTSEEFREKFNNLYVYSLRLNRKTTKKHYFSNKFESQLTQHCLNTWFKNYPYDIKNIWDKFSKSGSIKVERNTQLNYHLYLPNIKLKVFLSLTPEQCKEETISPSDKKKIKNIIKERNALIARQVSTSYCTVDTLIELNTLIALNESKRTEQIPLYNSIPSFNFCCQGDFISTTRSGSNLIHKQFESIIDFSYSIGVPLYTLTQESIDNLCEHSNCNAIDSQFLWLAWSFHRSWKKKLNMSGYTTFNDVFYDFSDPDHPAYNSRDTQRLLRYNHLLIDEFQDISPNIIGFFRQIKRHLYSNQARPGGSLICIGDDLQSIYGWRGSSALYITHFERYFTTDHTHESISLEANHRSHSTILTKGQTCADKVRNKSSKSYKVCANEERHVDPGCHIYPAYEEKFYSDLYSYIDYELAAVTLEKELEKRKPTKDKPIYILYRSFNNKYSKKSLKWNDLIKKNADKIKIIKSLTIHASKGLEGDCVIVLGNIPPSKTNPIREGLYYQSPDISSTYYEMQVDEGHRLAYVAITRAKQVLHWFFQSNSSSDNLAHYLLNE